MVRLPTPLFAGLQERFGQSSLNRYRMRYLLSDTRTKLTPMVIAEQVPETNIRQVNASTVLYRSVRVCLFWILRLFWVLKW